jgi:hypothetical protein
VPFLSPAAPALQPNKHGSEIETGPALLARRDHRAAVFFADFVDGADVRVIQCRGGPRFSPEAFQRLRPSARSPTSERASTARHFVYNEVGSVKANFSVHFFRGVFSSPIRIFFFLATAEQADFFFPLRSCEAVGLRREKSLFPLLLSHGLSSAL